MLSLRNNYDLKRQMVLLGEALDNEKVKKFDKGKLQPKKSKLSRINKNIGMHFIKSVKAYSSKPIVAQSDGFNFGQKRNIDKIQSEKDGLENIKLKQK